MKLLRTLLGALGVGLCLQASAQSQPLPYQNPSLSVEQRVEDLLSRLTLEEKVRLMMNGSPAIERLGIPQTDWWSEALHGVGRNGLSTVFPSCIGMACSFDDDLIERIYTAVSDEARAKNTARSVRISRGILSRRFCALRPLAPWGFSFRIRREPHGTKDVTTVRTIRRTGRRPRSGRAPRSGSPPFSPGRCGRSPSSSPRICKARARAARKFKNQAE